MSLFDTVLAPATDPDFEPVLDKQDYHDADSLKELGDAYEDAGLYLDPGLEDELVGLLQGKSFEDGRLDNIYRRAKQEWYYHTREEQERSVDEFPGFEADVSGITVNVHPVNHGQPKLGLDVSDEIKSFATREIDRMLEDGDVYVEQNLERTFHPSGDHPDFDVLQDHSELEKQSQSPTIDLLKEYLKDYATETIKYGISDREMEEEYVVGDLDLMEETMKDKDALPDLKNYVRSMMLPMHLEEEYMEPQWPTYNALVNERNKYMVEEALKRSCSGGERPDEIHIIVGAMHAPGMKDHADRARIVE